MRDSRLPRSHIEAICRQLLCRNRGWVPDSGLWGWGCSHTQGYCRPARRRSGSEMSVGVLHHRPCLSPHKRPCSFGLQLPTPTQWDTEQNQAGAHQLVQELELRQVPGRIGRSHKQHLRGKPRRCPRSRSFRGRICSLQCMAVRCTPPAY